MALTQDFHQGAPAARRQGHGQGGRGRRVRGGGGVRERRGRHAGGHALRGRAQEPRTVFEINGEKGTIVFNLERLNELEVYWVDEEPKETQGFHRRAGHRGRTTRSWSNWWPHGHIIGWEHTFVHEIEPPARLHREQQGRGPLRRDLRGRLPLRGHLRRDPGVGALEEAGEVQVLKKRGGLRGPGKR